MDESLTKALHSATFASGELQEALKTADAVTALVLLPMIADAARLAQQISGLIHAMADVADETPKADVLAWRTAARDADILRNTRRRVSRARDHPKNTCAASRHLHLMASKLARGEPYPMLAEEPQHCAMTMLSVLESLWKARTELERMSSALKVLHTWAAFPPLDVRDVRELCDSALKPMVEVGATCGNTGLGLPGRLARA